MHHTLSFYSLVLSKGFTYCRQLIADPAWVQKVISGKTEEIHRCVRCNQKCLGGVLLR